MSTCFDDLPLFRDTDPDTSRRIRTSRLNSNCMVLLSFYRQSSVGLTDEQAFEQALNAGHEIKGYWKRCSDLRRAGLIEDCGLRAQTSSGCKAMICKVTAEGEALK
jgi:hypothetical protein